MSIRDMKRGISFLLGLCLLLVSCSEVKDKYTIDEFNQYLKQENCIYSAEQRAGNVVYQIRFRPSALISAIENEADSVREKRNRELDKMYWFNVIISVDGSGQSPLRYGISGLADYNERLDYYLNRAGNDIWIENGDSKVTPGGYWFENNHNLTPYETIVVGFDRSMIRNEPITLCFNDRALRSGIIRSTFSLENLNKKIVITDR